MKLSMVSKKDELTILRVTDVGAAYMNSLRRVMNSETPVLAIEDVELRRNSSALYDEMIAHRLGMLSIQTDAKSYNIPEECACKGAGCAQCQVKMTLSAKGPCTVTADMMKSQDPNIKPVHGKTPLVRLLEGQELELEATAQMGLGVEHSKWNTGLIHYKQYPHITIKKPVNAKELSEKYPEVLELKANKLVVKEEALPYYDVYDALVNDSQEEIVLEYKDDYLLYIESWGQLSAQDIVQGAITRFDKIIDETKKLVKEV